MSDINPLSTYYSSLQSATSSLKKDSKKEKISSTSKQKFSELLQTNNDGTFNIQDFPKEIQDLSLEDAAVFLKDKIDVLGDALSKNPSTENLMEFKKSVQQFMKFVVINNYEINKKIIKKFSKPQQTFSKYNTKPRQKDPRVTINMINSNLDNLTRAMLFNQKDNLKLLSQINEIKGLIVDLMQS